MHLAQIDGERVVVKVQRPGLKSLFDIDLKNVRLSCASRDQQISDFIICASSLPVTFVTPVADLNAGRRSACSRRSCSADPKSDGAARDWVAIYDECSPHPVPGEELSEVEERRRDRLAHRHSILRLYALMSRIRMTVAPAYGGHEWLPIHAGN